MFSSRSPESTTAASQPAEPDATQTSDQVPASEGRQTAKPVPPTHPIVIAANPSESARLKVLSSAMPKEAVKIVDDKGNASRADFSVSTTMDRREGPDRVKLFTEQMHIIAGGAVHSIADLNGKVVSFGMDKSASQLAARKAFAALSVQVKETPLDLDNALDGLSSGDIAAVVLLAPQPDARLKRIAGPGLHLVAWPENGSLPEGAVSSSIDGGAYPKLAKPGATIGALGVDAVLILNPKEARQPAEKKFLVTLSQHSAQLSKRGFDLLKADVDVRNAPRVASAEKR